MADRIQAPSSHPTVGSFPFSQQIGTVFSPEDGSIWLESNWVWCKMDRTESRVRTHPPPPQMNWTLLKAFDCPDSMFTHLYRVGTFLSAHASSSGSHAHPRHLLAERFQHWYPFIDPTAATSQDAVDLGYRTCVVNDASRGVNARNIESKKRDLSNNGAVIRDSTEVRTCNCEIFY